MPTAFLHVRLDAPAPLLSELAGFYGRRLGLERTHADDDGVALNVGETVVEFRAAAGAPFYHVAFLVPGDRFEAALEWAGGHVDVLPDRETGEAVFDFTNWDAKAFYFHDPAGSIVELIAHHGVGDTGAVGAFSASELLGVSEVGLVGDPPALAEALARELGLEVWSGTVAEGRLAFVGDKARTLILCRAGRPWLPTGRPAEAHPLEVALVAGRPEGEVRLASGGFVRRGGTPAA